MFIVLLTYQAPLSKVDAFVAEHRLFLEHHYASGHFLMSGRQEPRTGGVILVQAMSKIEVEQIIATDPFYREQIAHYDIIEFIPSMTAPDLTHLVTH